MLALETKSIFHLPYGAFIDRLRAIVEAPTACHQPISRDTVVPSPLQTPDDAPCPKTKPPGPSMMLESSSTPSRGRKNHHRPIRRPAKGSIYDILRQHAGTSLFVRPTFWTDMHCQLLGAKFEELPPCDAPQPESIPGTPPSKGHSSPSRTIIKLRNSLTELLASDGLHPCADADKVWNIMSILWRGAFSQAEFFPELHIVFDGKRLRPSAMRPQIMWHYPGDSARSSQSSFRSISTRPAESYDPLSSSASTPHNPTGLPMMCYVGKSALAAVRNNPCRPPPGPGQSKNEPVAKLQKLRSKALIPANSDHDAQFLGILLAMAQRHFYGAHGGCSRAFEDIKLRILSHDNDTQEFIVYTGYMTSEFLDRFDNPRWAPAPDESADSLGIKIEYTRVPIWPILGLRERLGKACGEDVVGDFDASKMETWHNDDGKPFSFQNSKRKRESLSQVFNGSFEEDTDQEEDSSPLKLKKQRLQEGPPIGVGA